MACTDGDHYSIQSVAETPSKIQFMGYELEVRKGFYPTVYGEDHPLHYLKIPCAASDKLEGIAEHNANALRYAGIKYENCGKIIGQDAYEFSVHYSSEKDIQNALADYAAMQPKLQKIRTFIEAKLPDTDVRRKFIESITESLLRKTPNHEVYIRSDLRHYARGYNIPKHLLNDIGKEIETVTGIPATASSIMR